MTTRAQFQKEQEEFWNQIGGERWIANITLVESMLEPLSEQLLSAVAPKSAERILDIGCGGGPTSAGYAEAVGTDGEVLGVDISSVILDFARERFAHVSQLRFETADAGQHPLPPAHFDVVTSRFGVM